MDDLNPFLAVVIALIAGYALGSVSFAVWVGRMKGVDIRKEGSGNPGMSNVARTLGKGAAAMVLVGDLMKGVIASAIGHLLVPAPEALFSGFGLAALGGLAAVVGHCYPVLHRFMGGKGMATAFGALLYLNPMAALALGAGWFLLVKLTGKASLGSLAVVLAAIPAVMLVDVPNDIPGVALVWIGVMLVLVVYRHKDNIARLRSGSERSIEEA